MIFHPLKRARIKKKGSSPHKTGVPGRKDSDEQVRSDFEQYKATGKSPWKGRKYDYVRWARKRFPEDVWWLQEGNKPVAQELNKS